MAFVAARVLELPVRFIIQPIAAFVAVGNPRKFAFSRRIILLVVERAKHLDAIWRCPIARIAQFLMACGSLTHPCAMFLLDLRLINLTSGFVGLFGNSVGPVLTSGFVRTRRRRAIHGGDEK